MNPLDSRTAPGATASVAPPDLPPRPGLVIFALWLMVFSSGSQVMLISPIFPRIREQLGIAEAALGTLVAVDALALGLVAFIAGPISDRIGRRRILLAGTGLMFVALALHALAFDYYSLLSVRVLAGAAGGVLSGAAVAYVGDAFPYQRRGWATGWVMTGMAFGHIIGIPAGTVLAGHFGFRAAYLLFAATMLGAFGLVWRWVVQPPVQRSERLTIAGALRGYRDLLRQRAILAAVAVFAMTFLGNSLFVIYLPTWLETDFAASPTQVASLFLVGGIANVLTGPRSGRFSDRVGRKVVIISASLGLALVIFSVPWLVHGFATALLFFVLVMTLFAARVGPFQALLTQLVPGDRRGTLMSLTVGSGQMGFALGGMLAALTYERWGYAASTTVAAAIVLVTAIVIWRGLPEPEADSPPPMPAAMPAA